MTAGCVGCSSCVLCHSGRKPTPGHQRAAKKCIGLYPVVGGAKPTSSTSADRMPVKRGIPRTRLQIYDTGGSYLTGFPVAMQRQDGIKGIVVSYLLAPSQRLYCRLKTLRFSSQELPQERRHHGRLSTTDRIPRGCPFPCQIDTVIGVF